MSESDRYGGTALPRPDRPPRQAAELRQSPRRGQRLGAVGWLAVTLGAVCLGLVSTGVPAWERWAQDGAGLVLVMAGAWVVLRGRRNLTRVLSGLHLLPADERIVLFLRGFSDDKGFSRTHVRRRVLSGPNLTPADVRTEEEQVARALAPFGRMVALGNPKDTLPFPGADRRYASDETWRDEVLAALDRAEFVLLAAGSGRGLDWEVEQVVRRHDPTRLVLVAVGDRRQYAPFREKFQDCFPRGLPVFPVTTMRQRLLRSRYVRAVIWFDSDWTPHLEMLDGRFPLIGAARRTQRALQRALGSVYQRAGVPARVTPTTARPGAVKFSVAFILVFWLSPFIWLSAAAAALAGFAGPSSGPDSAHPSSSFVGVLVSIWPLWLPLIALLAPWLYRVWHGGPVAITAARIQGLLFPVLLLTLAFSWVRLAGLALALAALAALHPWLLIFSLALLVLSMLGMPATTLLLIRHNVREWIDSRL